MRTTLSMIHSTSLTNLNQVTSAMERLNRQISSGKDYSTISENPNNLLTALGLRTSLSEIGQYQQNLVYGDNLIATSENALTEIKSLLGRAKTLNIQAVNGSLSNANRVSMASEIKNLFEEAINLANSQLNGKYIFAGYRTTGYNEIEPTPFMTDKADGYRIRGSSQPPLTAELTGTPISNTAIAAGALEVNGNAVGAINNGATTHGINMDKAANAKAAIMAADPTVTASLTTLFAGVAATADAGAGSTIAFDLNNVTLTVTVPAATTAAGVATLVAAAVNSVTDQSGVAAAIGDGTNGGAINSMVLSNSRAGDESAIIIANLQEPGTAASGLANGAFSIALDPNSNTGRLSLSSASSFQLGTPAGDDSILQELGLDGGARGFADEPSDGDLIYGARLADDALQVNGIGITGITADGISNIYADASAAAKANAINALTETSKVRAEVEPVSINARLPVEAGSEKAGLTGLLTNSGLAAGALAINGVVLGAIASGPPTNGLSMLKAANAKAAVNSVTSMTGVTARLTTLATGGIVTAGTTTTVSFDLNNVNVSFNTNNDPASDAAAAINSVKDRTGVTAAVGDGKNGAPIGQLVLTNTLAGDETAIVVTNFNGGAGTADTGLGNLNQAPDATHNTGTLTFTATRAMTLSGSGLDQMGLDGGEPMTGIPGDLADDGTLTHGSTAAYIGAGDLLINGVDIFDKATLVAAKDNTNSLIGAINAKTDLTGIKASIDADGTLILTASDGRNLHVQTSATGERITHLNQGSPATPQSTVYFGTVRLVSDRIFSLESTPTTSFEPGLAALGLAGGETMTGEAGDLTGDGVIEVDTIHTQTGNVRYTGDRANGLAIKVGSRSSLIISQNGMDTFMNTEVLSALKTLENLLNSQKFTETTGSVTVSDTTAPLGTAASGLTGYQELIKGSFTVTITDNQVFPPSSTPYAIGFDPTTDTATSMAQKLNGLPGLTATWEKNGALTIASTDPSRYSFDLAGDSSNFLTVASLNQENNQANALTQSIGRLDTAMEALTTQISDYGARASRIQVQNTIYSNLELGNKAYLSEKEDTDMIKALMDLKAKEVAYQAALASSAKAMQLSLVDFLR